MEIFLREAVNVGLQICQIVPHCAKPGLFGSGMIHESGCLHIEIAGVKFPIKIVHVQQRSGALL